jgi:methyltransferase-like protein
MRGVARVLAKQDTAYGRCLREEAERSVSHNEYYLAHEHLAETNRPVYFHEFVDRAAAHGLRYLTEAEYWHMGATQPPELFQAFGDSPLDWLGREQLYDFLVGRAFRLSVLCHAEVSCSRTPSAQALLSLWITTRVRPAAAGPAPSLGQREDFHDSQGALALSTNDPVVRAALRVLAEAWPRSLAFETLWARTQERLATSWGISAPGLEDATSRARLAEAMLDTFGHNIVELHVQEPEFTTEIGEFPRASPVARRQAATAQRVANLRHQMIALVDCDQAVLRHLDGRHDRRALLAALEDAVRVGGCNVPSQGRPITHPAAEQTSLVHRLEKSLRRLANAALFVD